MSKLPTEEAVPCMYIHLQNESANREQETMDENKNTANDRQVGGDHYKNRQLQPWDVVDTFFSHAEAIGFYRGSALKYLLRAGTKHANPAIQDYQKAEHYLQKLIETLK